MTIGQRIAQKRKALGLSQEALGNQLGVSRQSIYKWESDAAMPEIDKLIALSRLFGVSVGWLLGVEAPTESEHRLPLGGGGEAETASGELTEAQLKMVEEIVQRYAATMSNSLSPRRRKALKPAVAVGSLCLILILFNLFQRLDQMDQQYSSLQNNISRIESSVNGQIGSISGRVEEILKAQNSLVADYGVEILSSDLARNQVTFSVHAVPKTYSAGMSVEFSLDNGSDEIAYTLGERISDGSFTGTLVCTLTDTISISAVFITPNGTRSTQLLEQYGGLYSDSLPSVDLMNYSTGDLLWMEAADTHGRLTLPEVYLTVGAGNSVSAVNAAIGQSELAGIQVGLFRNKTRIAWLEQCEQPENFHGEYDGKIFFHLPEGIQTALTQEIDQLCFAAVVTDEYGREAVYSDIPYVLQDGELGWPTAADISDHDPANWSY